MRCGTACFRGTTCFPRLKGKAPLEATLCICLPSAGVWGPRGRSPLVSSDKAEGGGPLGALFRNWYEDILALRCASDTNANATKVSENWLRPSARFYPFQG